MIRIKDTIKRMIPSNLLIYELAPNASNSILLTFDDGPDRNITPLVLQRLEEYQVRAIFFVIGQKAEQFPDLLKMIQEKGHFIGNHTYKHPDSKLPGFFSYRRDIKKCQQVIKDITGVTPTLFRPPRGIVSPTCLLAAKSLKLAVVLWSNEGGEWGKRKFITEDGIGKDLVELLCPRQIVLLHDNNLKVPKILDIILPYIKHINIDVYNGARMLLPREGERNE